MPSLRVQLWDFLQVALTDAVAERVTRQRSQLNTVFGDPAAMNQRIQNFPRHVWRELPACQATIRAVDAVQTARDANFGLDDELTDELAEVHRLSEGLRLLAATLVEGSSPESPEAICGVPYINWHPGTPECIPEDDEAS